RHHPAAEKELPDHTPASCATKRSTSPETLNWPESRRCPPALASHRSDGTARLPLPLGRQRMSPFSRPEGGVPSPGPPRPIFSARKQTVLQPAASRGGQQARQMID